MKKVFVEVVMYRFLLSFLAIVSFSYVNASELSPANGESGAEKFFDAPEYNVQLPAAADVPYLHLDNEYDIVKFQPGSYFSVVAFMIHRMPFGADQRQAQNFFTQMCHSNKFLRVRVFAESQLFSKVIMPITPQLVKVFNKEENEHNLLIFNERFVESLENFLAKEKDEHEKAREKKKADTEARFQSIVNGNAAIAALGMKSQRAFVRRDSSSGSDSEGESSSGVKMFRSAVDVRREQAQKKAEMIEQETKRKQEDAEYEKEVYSYINPEEKTVVQRLEGAAANALTKIENFFAGWR